MMEILLDPDRTPVKLDFVVEDAFSDVVVSEAKSDMKMESEL